MCKDIDAVGMWRRQTPNDGVMGYLQQQQPVQQLALNVVI